MRALVIAALVLLVASPAFAGPNPSVSLAMHTIGSDAYLYCPELWGMIPYWCHEIDNSLEQGDLEPYGYGYVCLVSYGMDAGMTGVEYCIGGWPTVRGSPPIPVVYYCPVGSLFLGAAFDGGVIQTFGEDVVSPWPCGMLLFAYFSFQTSVLDPDMELFYCDSAQSYPLDPHNYVLGPPPGFVEDDVVGAHGCTILGIHWEVVPYSDCAGATATEATTWSNVKAMYK